MVHRSRRASRRVPILFAAVLAATTSAVVTPAAAPAPTPTDVFLSEVIEGSSNNKALEIYNGTGSAINLATGQYVIQMYFNGSAAAGLTIGLTGSVANGDVYVVANGGALQTILDQADQTNSSGWFNGDDAILLRKGGASGTIVDSVGQVGVDPGAEWGTGDTSTGDNTIRRKDTVCAGDPDAANAFDPSIEWNGFPQDTFGGLGAHTALCLPDDVAPSVSSTYPANGQTDVALTSSIYVTFSEDVTASGAWYTLNCDLSGAHAAAVTGGPRIFKVNPDADFAVGDQCTFTVVAGQISDSDANDPPDNLAVNFVVGFTARDVCLDPFTTIPAIQGSGLNAAITGTVTTQGVVVGDFEGTAAASGFYLQDAAGDGNAASSDGIFVFTGSQNLASVGDVVRVTGFARERNNQTTLNGSNSSTAAVLPQLVVACGTADLPARTDVTLPFDSLTSAERYEGMRVRFPQDLTISEYFNYDRFGEIVLALPLDGEPRPFSPTALSEPGGPAQARLLANQLRRITLDDVQSVQNPDVLRHPNGDPFALNNRFRGGDRVENAVGILGFDFSLYRILPTGPADYTAVNDRPSEPEAIGGNVHVAAMNTLNYFLTLDATVSDAAGTVGPCGGNANLDCRGADADQPDEFSRQRVKLLEALAGLDADVIGLNELENTPGVNPSEDLADGLGGYEDIHTGPIGTDAIKVGMIYRPSVVTPVGDFQTLDSNDDPRFIDTRSRPALAQTFEVNATGARFTVVVNHLKSKGSACEGDPDTGDGQGNCSETRRLAAEAIVDWLATDPTGSGDPDFLIMGDLNSYALEDTIDEIRDGPDDTTDTDDDFVNLIRRYQGEFAYSYTFDGMAGYLDYAIANRSLARQVEGAADWHINSDEPDILDYDTSFKPPAQEALFQPNQYRTSDHDPVIVGMTLLGPPAVAEPVIEPEPSEEGETVVASATFTPVDGDVDDAFTCTVDYGDGSGAVDGTVDGTMCTGPDHVYAEYGTYTLTVTVEDEDDETGSASSEHTVVFAFRGFDDPLDDEGFNRMKAGAAVPLKFSLTGDQGLAILADGSPTSRQVACDTSEPSDPVEETVTSGGSSLAYDVGTDTYTYVWKIRKAWSGTCRELSLELVDGTTHTALFQFTK